MTAPLIVSRDGHVARVTLDRPDVHNAFDDVVIARLHETARELGEDEAVRVVVLSGAGESFCAGADLHWMKRTVAYSREENIADAETLARMFEAWLAIPKPVVGRIHGAALGGGAGLVAICDIAVASTRAVFGFTEARLGILPAVISPFVLRKVGPGAARALFLTGERFSAARAYEIGLVQRLAEPGVLDQEIDAVVQLLLGAGPRAQAAIKALLAELVGHSPEKARPTTTKAIADARASTEGQEGMLAFLERRRAAWRQDA